MEQTVYVDLLFLINFSMDFLCLFLSARLLHRKTALGRWLIAAVLGGGYAVCALFLPINGLLALAIDLLACILLCAIAFGTKGGWRSLPLCTIVYVAVSAALGGFMTALFSLLNRTNFASVQPEESGGEELSIWLFLLLAAISGGLTLWGGRFFHRKSQQQTVQLCITYGGKSLTLCALVDSGNLLQDPISGKACIPVDLPIISPLLPPRIRRAAQTGSAAALSSLPPTLAARMRLIPVHTVSGESVLMALRPDHLTICDNKGSREIDALILLSPIGQSADGADALLPAQLL